MKKNLKKVSMMVFAVGMLSATSLTAFGATVPAKAVTVPLTKVQHEKEVAGNLKGNENIAISTTINSDNGTNAELLTVLDQYQMEEQPDGTFRMIDKNTGDVIVLSFAEVEVDGDGANKPVKAIKAAVLTSDAIKK